MYCPPPPCYASDTFVACAETSWFCRRLGKLGFKWWLDRKSAIMLVAAMLSLLGVVLQLIPVIALSKNKGVIKNTSWTYGKADDSGEELFIGLNGFVLTQDDDSTYTNWNAHDCDDTSGTGDGEFCQDCKDACDAAVTVAIMALITSIPQLLTDFQRSTDRGDLNCQKFMALLTGVLGCVGTLAALSTYADGCLHNLPDEVTDPTNGDDISITWVAGPSFVCLILATLLKPVDVIVHLLTPTPPSKWDPDLLGLTADQSDLSKGINVDVPRTAGDEDL